MAIVDRAFLRRGKKPADTSTSVVGDVWAVPAGSAAPWDLPQPERRWVSLRSSPLTRKIITFNLVALVILVAGILHLNDSYRSLALQRAGALISEAELIADVFEVQQSSLADPVRATKILQDLSLRGGIEVLVFDTTQRLLGRTRGAGQSLGFSQIPEAGSERTVIGDALSGFWARLSGLAVSAEPQPSLEDQLRGLIAATLRDGTQVNTGMVTSGGIVFAAVAPILLDHVPVGVVAVASPSGQIDAFVKTERERVLQMFVVAILVSIGLSLVLASTISNPLADLAAAAELGRDKHARKVNPGRIRIPDLTARPDEIGRLSSALRGMVAALYTRIDGNEQFAADVSHEIKNPLASLRSAVGTLRVVQRDDQRKQLLDVIEHDVRRLDRLVSDISNASRLDSELVKEEEEPFNLLAMLENLNQYLGEDARARSIDYITDMPQGVIEVHGLEPRLAQVFVNLITNAISFCEPGDAIRVWVRKREHRVLVVVEDTGPGIPDEALGKVFKRFYSQRPEEHFGNNSGLGLAISKQIIEAHGGVIWAENIRPTEADITSEPLGARFLVGLPV